MAVPVHMQTEFCALAYHSWCRSCHI